jgi:hypothetical protein
MFYQSIKQTIKTSMHVWIDSSLLALFDRVLASRGMSRARSQVVSQLIADFCEAQLAEASRDEPLDTFLGRQVKVTKTINVEIQEIITEVAQLDPTNLLRVLPQVNLRDPNAASVWRDRLPRIVKNARRLRERCLHYKLDDYLPLLDGVIVAASAKAKELLKP